MVTSASEPVSLQPTSSSLLKIAAPEITDSRSSGQPVDPVKLVDPVQLNSSSSSLMEASCETEILELELNRATETGNSDPEMTGGVVTCDLVSFSDEPVFADPLKPPEQPEVAPSENCFAEDAGLVPPNGESFKKLVCVLKRNCQMAAETFSFECVGPRL